MLSGQSGAYPGGIQAEIARVQVEEVYGGCRLRSGADVSVAPLKFKKHGEKANSGLLLQDAQSNAIVEQAAGLSCSCFLRGTSDDSREMLIKAAGVLEVKLKDRPSLGVAKPIKSRKFPWNRQFGAVRIGVGCLCQKGGSSSSSAARRCVGPPVVKHASWGEADSRPIKQSASKQGKKR